MFVQGSSCVGEREWSVKVYDSCNQGNMNGKEPPAYVTHPPNLMFCGGTVHTRFITRYDCYRVRIVITWGTTRSRFNK